jgi:two-component system OmpR family sensor kinase
MTLRRRILLGLMVLVGMGLVVTDGALWFGIHNYLYGQVDTQLTSFANSGPACGGSNFGFPDRGGSPSPGLPATSYVAFVSTTGQVLCSGFLDSQAASGSSPPRIPTSFGTAAGDSPLGAPFNASSSSGSSGYRMLAEAGQLREQVQFGFSQDVDGTILVAIPTGSVGSTLDRLRLIELVTTLLILLALLGGAWSMIRVGLRPLDDMTDTAGAIAAGDLSKRVPTGDPRTEVGRLGAALNTMLAQIETAFAARERSESRLRRFVADASHELRTPLTSIRGYAELFRRGAAQRPEDLATAMRRIEEEATRMSFLVEDLLQLARLDIAASERSEPLRGPVDLSAIARDAAADLLAVEPERPVEIDAGDAVATGDADALRQVAANLVANARHHTPVAARVTVRTGTTEDGRVAYLEVADAGPGMTESDASHVFERFWRGDPARTRGHGGAGLGLSIVAAIVEAHGGNVGLVTASGAGSCFRVELPAVGDGASVDPPIVGGASVEPLASGPAEAVGPEKAAEAPRVSGGEPAPEGQGAPISV